MKNKQLEKYLRTRAVQGPWRLDGVERSNYRAAVVIPALAESAALPETIAALAKNPPELLKETLVVIVVNNRSSASAEHKADNHQTLKWLQSHPCPQLHLAWIDASSSGREFPFKDGVGLARKAGFDLAMEFLDWLRKPLLISLDADTRVDADYLPAIFAYFQDSCCGGAIISFKHQSGQTPQQEKAIREYELYLRSYLFGLQIAGSPYAYHAIGSAFACRADSYIAAGGMNRRSAAEDFYFLQQLAKVAGVEMLRGTVVRPSPRFSDRVPFGTGRAVQAYAEEGKQLFHFVPATAFQLLKVWLELVSQNLSTPAESILHKTQEISPLLNQFLKELDFPRVWKSLQTNHSQDGQRIRAFHHWFDALRTRQLLTRVEPDRVVSKEALMNDLLCWGGAPDEQSPLQFLEREQGVC